MTTAEVLDHLRIDSRSLKLLIYESDEAGLEAAWVCYGSGTRPRRRWNRLAVNDWFEAVGRLRRERERERLLTARAEWDAERRRSRRRVRSTKRSDGGTRSLAEVIANLKTLSRADDDAPPAGPTGRKR